VSPPIAEVLTNHPALRAGTRVLLRPVIWAAQGALEAPFLAFAVGAVLGLGSWVVVRQWWRGWRGRR
jgi:hypothetical protein